MNVAFAMTLTVMAIGTAAFAETPTESLCGDGHFNEVVSGNDVVANPDGYYIRSLKAQISHGDPRIILSSNPNFRLCTTGAATPEMGATKALSLMGKRRLKFLFVPVDCPKQFPNT